MPTRSMSNRTIRRVLEVVVGIALLLLVFTVFCQGRRGVAYFLGAVVALLLLANLLRKWPSV